MINTFTKRERKIYKFKFYQMTNTVILASITVVAVLYCSIEFVEARATSSPTTTTNIPTAYIEDSFDSATSESGENDYDCPSKCYQQVDATQSLIGVHMDLIKKQNSLIKRKHKAAGAPTTPIPKTTKKPRSGQQQNSTSTIINRTLNNIENKTIVVSRLRVARSTNYESHSTEFDSFRDTSKRNIDPALKQLRHKLKQQLNDTCRSLYEVQHCLEKISRVCVGDLQFHSLEVFASQWSGKLNCPPSNNPSFKLFKELTRSVPKLEERVPIPRSISSPEETQKKLDAILGGGPRTSLGVMLRPGLTRTASQKFNSISDQKFDGSDVDAHGQLKSRNILSGNEIFNDGSKGAFITPITAQLLLVPCFLVLLMSVMILTKKIKDYQAYR